MITKKAVDIKPGEHFMTYTNGMRGWFAAEMWMNNESEHGPFPEPWASDDLSYNNSDKAKKRAMWLAEAEDLPFVG